MSIQNIEKLLNMLNGEIIKITEQSDVGLLNETIDELNRFNKTTVTKLTKQRDEKFIELLDGKKEAKIGKYQVSYLPTIRRTLDQKLIDKNIQDEDLKELFFEKKPITLAKAEKICLENQIDLQMVVTTKEGNKTLKIK